MARVAMTMMSYQQHVTAEQNHKRH